LDSGTVLEGVVAGAVADICVANGDEYARECTDGCNAGMGVGVRGCVFMFEREGGCKLL